MWRKWKKQKEGCEKELKGCNLPLIWLALKHKGMLGNQCRLIATFTELQKTQKPTLPVFLFLYLQLFLYPSLSLSLSVTRNPALVTCSVYWENIRQTQLNSQSGERCWSWHCLTDCSVCVWGCESVYVRQSEKQNAASEVWLLSTAQQLCPLSPLSMYTETHTARHTWQMLAHSWHSYPVWRTQTRWLAKK